MLLPSISSDVRAILWIATGISAFIFILLAIVLWGNIEYSLRNIRNGAPTSRPPTYKPAPVWLLFIFSGLFVFAGTAIASAAPDPPPNHPGAFVVQGLTEEEPTPAAEPLPEEAPQLQVGIDFPDYLDPCSVDAMTFIPEDIDPYNLPPVASIDPWFDQHEFANRAYASLRVIQQSGREPVELSNRVIARLNSYQPVDESPNAAFSLCGRQEIRQFPLVEINPLEETYSQVLSEGSLVLSRGDSHHLEVEFQAAEPGLYELQVGVEYTYQGEVYQAWAPETVVVRAPHTLQRWSGGLITYWGACTFNAGEYECEETELAEPQLTEELPATSGDPAGTSETAVCTTAPDIRLAPGQEATVSSRLGLRLRIRQQPGLESEIITAFPRETLVTVQDGPVCQDGYQWWRVQVEDGTQGWMAEGERRLYYLEPVSP